MLPTYAAPFALLYIPNNGQSLSSAFGSNDAGQPVQPFANLKLGDTANTFDIAAPGAPTLFAAPLTTPQRPITSSTPSDPYPDNILNNTGSTVEVAAANMLSSLLPGWNLHASCVSQGAAAMSVIKKGGTGNAYAATIYEGQAFAPVSPANPSGGNLAAKAGFSSYGPAFVIWGHGQTDSELLAYQGITPATQYQSDLDAQQVDFETDLGAIATGPRPLWLPTMPVSILQPNSSPPSFAGRSIVRDAMTDLVRSFPERFIPAGPLYQYPPDLAFGPYHLNVYSPWGEKATEFFARYVREFVNAFVEQRPRNPLAWLDLRIQSIAFSGATATVTLHNPSGTDLVFDTSTVVQPHQVMMPYWGPGFGFEVWDSQVNVSNVTQTSPPQVTTTTPHGVLASGEPYLLEGLLGVANNNPGGNGAFWAHVVGPSDLTLFLDPGLTTPAPAGVVAFTTPATGLGVRPIGITSATITSRTTIELTLSRAPIPGEAFVAYAEHTDEVYTSFQGAVPPRGGNVRDSDFSLFDRSLCKAACLAVGCTPPMWCNWLNGETLGPL